MSGMEYLVVGAAVAAALVYLGLRLGRKFGNRGCSGGCCPVATRKIQPASRSGQPSSPLP